MTQGSPLELAASPDNTALNCTQLGGGYGRELVVRDFSFTFASGRVYGLLGSNGAGKSTLLRLLSQVLPAQAGIVALDSRKLQSLSPRLRARLLALVPQLTPPALSLTVAEALALARYAHASGPDPTGPACIESAVEALALQDLLNQHCDQLSGGQWRRVLVAQGLAQLAPQGGILLLDEPGAFLDPPARTQLFERLTREARLRGRCVIITMHDLPAAGEHCDELLLLKGGRLLAHGTPEAMLRAELLTELYSTDAAGEFREVA